MNNITNYYGDLGIFLYYTPIVSAFMAAFALLANRRRTPSQTWLALVLVTLGTGMAASFLFDRYFSASHSEIFRPVNFIFSTANSIVILFYYVSLMRPQLLTRKYMLYFSGGWALFSLFVLLPGTFSTGSGYPQVGEFIFAADGFPPSDYLLHPCFLYLDGCFYTTYLP